MPITLESFNEIEVLIHCHVAVEPHPRRDALKVLEALEKLQECGAITPCNTEGCYCTTPLGRAWLRALTRVPRPTLQYVDADGELLGEAWDIPAAS